MVNAKLAVRGVELKVSVKLTVSIELTVRGVELTVSVKLMVSG